MVIVTTTLALSEEYGHAFSHVDAKESIKISYHAGNGSERYRLENRIVCKMFPSECRELHVELDHECPI